MGAGFPRVAKRYAPATTATGITDDLIVNDDVNSAAAIAFTKLAALANGKILIGSAANVATAVIPAGHVAVTNLGVVSVLGGAAAAASDFTVTAVATKDIIMKCGDAAGASTFKVADSAGVVLFKVDSTGVITLENGATITNSTAADTITITETKIGLTGATTVTGALTVTGGMTGTASHLVYGHHTGIGIADLTATFGDPAAITNGASYVYKNDTDAKIYTVHVVGTAFFLHEAAAAV